LIKNVLARESKSDRSLVVFFQLFFVQPAPDLILADDLSVVIGVAAGGRLLNIGSTKVVITHPLMQIGKPLFHFATPLKD